MSRWRLLAVLTEQRWMIPVELVILIVGVFLGVQVDRWYEDRKEAREDRNYLARLSADVREMVADYDSLRLVYQQMYDEAVVARDALSTCRLAPEDRAVVEEVLSSHQVLYSFPVSRSTYDEMIASGAFARIENVALKAQAARLFTLIEFGQDTIGYLRQDLGRASDMILHALPFTNDETGQLKVDEFDLASVCGRVEIRSAMAEVVDSRADWLKFSGFILAQIDALEPLLEPES